jgi:hypothetical protein
VLVLKHLDAKVNETQRVDCTRPFRNSVINEAGWVAMSSDFGDISKTPKCVDFALNEHMLRNGPASPFWHVRPMKCV